jgi:hypothetical protein
MLKPAISVGIAALAAAGIALADTAPGALPADGRLAAAPSPFAQGERFSTPLRGTACSQLGWPNFEPKCQFDVREPGSNARTVRVIALR